MACGLGGRDNGRGSNDKYRLDRFSFNNSIQLRVLRTAVETGHLEQTMESARKCVFVIIVALLVSSCTVAYYQIRNRLSNESQEHSEPCEIMFSLDISSGFRTNTFGVQESSKDWLQRLKSKYIESTKEVLNKKGCAATYVNSEGEANFKVRVKGLLNISALPQEWLTGLSFGLIPSWGTRPSEYIYTFEDTKTNKIHTYYIDKKSYSHLILFPVFWVTFITLDEFKIYEKALANFIEGS